MPTNKEDQPFAWEKECKAFYEWVVKNDFPEGMGLKHLIKCWKAALEYERARVAEEREKNKLRGTHQIHFPNGSEIHLDREGNES